MRIKTEMLQAGEVVIRFDGSLDRRTVPAIRKQVLRVGRNRGTRSVVVDFSQVTEMDTAGIALLVELLQVLSRTDGKLQLAGLSEGIQRIIRLARLEQVFAIKPDAQVTTVQ